MDDTQTTTTTTPVTPPAPAVQTTVNTGNGVTTGHGVTTAGGKEWAQSEAARVAAEKAAAAPVNVLTAPAPETSTTTPADWPADWRTKATQDPKTQKLLERYNSPTDVVKALADAQALISSGKLKTVLPKDATPEQVAQYRQENGVPETPDKYDLTLSDGLVIGEADKPVINNMLQTMHGQNLNNDQVKALLATYYQNEKQYMVDMANKTSEQRTQAQEALRKEWGAEYQPNINLVNGLLDTFPVEAQDVFNNARGPDGLPLLNNTSALRALTLMARQINPTPTITGGTPGNQMASVDTEIQAIEKRMSEDRAGYFKDEKAQARYRELLSWKENQKKPAA